MIRVVGHQLRLFPVRTRMPFRYGIASLTQANHLLLRLELDTDGSHADGFAADTLAPKWFAKNPHSIHAEDERDMLEVIRAACRHAQDAGPSPTVFDLWRDTYQRQKDWASATPHPPLLWGFGVSLVERAMIDAFCRARGLRLRDALVGGGLGFAPEAIDPELAGLGIADAIPPEPAVSCLVRHTVGLADPLLDEQIPPDERLEDGLPQSLDAAIRRYGLRGFKIKLFGDAERDLDRLIAVGRILKPLGRFACTIDGNENYPDLATFRGFWERLRRADEVQPVLRNLHFVEQPLHRDRSLGPQVARALADWPDHPPLVIDESDSTTDAFAQALETGYSGTTHKNCKGVFKSLANAALIRRRDPLGRRLILSGEDLTNLPPVALPQDLAVIALLGIPHVERNGHHYFRGLSMLNGPTQDAVLRTYRDLYDPSQRSLQIVDGRLSLVDSASQAFGHGIDPGLLATLGEPV